MGAAGRTAIVTGGARGIGAAYVRALAASGMRVAIADVLENEGERLAQAIGERQSAQVIFVRTDVTTQADTIHMAEYTARRFGGVDVLVNNAAIYADLATKKPFHEISEAEWDSVMSVNVKGVWHCTKAVFPYMEKQGGGKIINVSSATVYAGTLGLAHYVASKAAVIGLTRALARELGGHRICVNAVAPGLVYNEASSRLNPPDYFEDRAQQRSIKRAMVPEDLVGTVLFLASPGSDFVTGQTFVVDGGAVFG
jgi:NAD(P)-dependent dehydrogenase (short-subunit alcohol dehydrogenase family)